MTVLGVDVLDCFVNSVLANVFSRELVSTSMAGGKRDSVVHEVDIVFSPVAEVADKAIKVVTLWAFVSAVFVKV